MRYSLINYVILRSSGIPLEYLDSFNFESNFLDSLNKENIGTENIYNKINLFLFNSRKQLFTLIKDKKLRDMTRISSQNYRIFLRKLESFSLLSQYHRKLLLYLQRGCTKCCTAGSYGPVAIGIFEHSAQNLDVNRIELSNYILLESWFLQKIISSLCIRLNEKKFHKIMENYTLLRCLNINKLNDLVNLIDQYRVCDDPDIKDIIFSGILDLSYELTKCSFRKR